MKTKTKTKKTRVVVAKNSAPIAPPPVHKAQRFESRRVARLGITNAPYNPRKILARNRGELEKILKQFGLVEPLVWNERSGNLVGGHQRLQILDALSESPEYSLDVAVVSVNDLEEKALNIALNARGAQGEFEREQLAELVLEIEPALGFDLKNLFVDDKEFQKLIKSIEDSGEPPSFNYKPQFGVIAVCADEQEQQQTYDKLVELGFENLRVVNV